MSSQGFNVFRGLHIPKSHGFVLTATGKGFAVVAPGYGPDFVGVTLKDPQGLTRFDFPDPQGFIA